MDPLLQYACRRVAEMESLLLVEVSETVWPAEVGMVYNQIENAGDLPVHHQRRLQHHINRMWLEKMPGNDTFLAAVNPARLLLHTAGESIDVHNTLGLNNYCGINYAAESFPTARKGSWFNAVKDASLFSRRMKYSFCF